jgi:hypothetical protein
MKFALWLNVDDELLDVEQARVVGSTLHKLADDVGRWRAVTASKRLRDQAGNVIGWAGIEDDDDPPAHVRQEKTAGTAAG